jgi:Flp pilus assembly protein TadD
MRQSRSVWKPGVPPTMARSNETAAKKGLAIQASALSGGVPHSNRGLLASSGVLPGRSTTRSSTGGLLPSSENLDATGWFDLGNALFLSGDIDGAARCYRHAALLNPSDPEPHYNFGVARERQGRLAEAVTSYRAALNCNPSHANAHNNLAALLQHSDPHAARLHYDHALLRNPGHPQARYNSALLMQEQEQLEEAESCWRALLKTDPLNGEVRNNLGNTLLQLGRAEEARAEFRQVLAHLPAHAQARWNLGLAELLAQHWKEGWEGFEWRFRQPGAAPARFPDQTRWKGERSSGTLLVHAEQGLGDTLQFLRFLPQARLLTGSLLVECQPPLRRLLEGVRGADQVFSRGDLLPPFERHLPMMSLPYVLGAPPVSMEVPYLEPPLFSSRWRQGPRLHVSVTWQGNRQHRNDHNRSIPPAVVERLGRIPGIELFTLQKDWEGASPFPAAHHPEASLTDFADTAAFLMEMDLVVSVDTAVAHLAGALGREVWTLLPFAPDWRWGESGDRTPWYPTTRLWRQKERKNWGEVIERVAAELEVRALAL